MCGIHIIIDKTGKHDEGVIKKMLGSTIYRGPDNPDHYKFITPGNGSVYLGANRLRITDISSHADQPFISVDKKKGIVFNGQIYNHKELRNNKTTYNTSSDTETIFKLLKQEGPYAISKFNGMYAFAYCEENTNSLILARDPAGIKPLYFYEDEKVFIASSEIKGILATGLVRKEFNHHELANYFKYKYVQRPQTFYKNIFELDPGKILRFDLSNYQKSFQEIPFERKEVKFSMETIEDLILKSMERQLKTDVPAALFFSGGTDSTLILSYAQELGIDLPLHTISFTNNDSFGTDDFQHASKIAGFFDKKIIPTEVGISDLKRLPEFIKSTDQPVADPAAFLTFLLSENASKDARVAFSGAGADELFGGYNRHAAYYKYLKYFAKSPLLLKLANTFSGILPEGQSHGLRKQFRLLNKFSSQISKDSLATFDNFTSLSGIDLSVFCDPSDQNQKTFNGTLKTNSDELLQMALEHDRNNFLISDVLAITDRYSMISSLEVRVPFLDLDLVNHLKALPASQILKKGRKWILGDILKRRVKQSYQRPKEGFGFPIGSWVKEAEAKPILDKALEQNSKIFEYVNKVKVNRVFYEHLINRKDYSAEIWAFIFMSDWLEENF